MFLYRYCKGDCSYCEITLSMPPLMLYDDDVQPTQLSNASILNVVGSQVDSELKAEVTFSCSGVRFFTLAVPHTLESILKVVAKLMRG